MRQSRSASFRGRGCAKQRQRQVLISADDAATISLWGFVNDDWKKLMRLAFAHRCCMRGALDFGRCCAVAREILGGDMALIVRTAGCLELMPRGVTHHRKMLEEIASKIATAEASTSV